MPVDQPTVLRAILDTGGITADVDASTVADNIFVYAIPGIGTGKARRIIDGSGIYRAGWGAVYGGGDKTSVLQAIFNKSEVHTVVVDTSFAINSTLTIPTGKVLKFHSTGAITGTGTISGGLLEAESRRKIFDSTLTITNMRTNSGVWSGMWFGAVGDNVADDVVPLQKGIDYVIANAVNVKNFYLPGGIYKTTKGLIVLEKNVNEYNQINIRIFGDLMSQRMITGDETYINMTSDSSFVIGLQENKGTIVENLGILGNNTISYSNATAYSSSTTYIQGSQRTNRYSPQAGIVFDPFAIDVVGADQYPDFTTYYTNSSNGGCTSCVVRNVRIQSVVVGMVMSPAVGTQNNECHIFDHIWLANMRQGISTCNSQERLTKCTNIYAWTNVKTIFDSATYGSRHGDAPIVDGVNTAGNIYQLLNIGGGLGSVVTSISNAYCESLYRIGSSVGHLSATFHTCNFKFADATSYGLKQQDFIYEDGTLGKTEFSGCNLLFFYANGQYPMNFGCINVAFKNCQLNQQVGNYYGANGAIIQSGAWYENIDFYAIVGVLMNRHTSSLGTNYALFPGGRFVDMGNLITTVNPASGVSTVLTYQTKQIRQVTSPFVKRITLGTATVTVTGSGATCTIAGLANVAAYNGRLVYVNVGYSYTGILNSYIGGQVMRLVSIDASGVITFDRVVESFVTGSYTMYVEIPSTVPLVSVANVSGTSITNWYSERTGIFTPSANGLYTVGGSNAYFQTTTTVGAGTATITASQTAGIVTFSACEYIEYGISHQNPATNANFPQYTVFTKGAVYINPAYNGPSDIISWVCTKSGCKGSGVIEPEFKANYATDVTETVDSFSLTTTGSRTVAVGETLYEIQMKPTANMTGVSIGTSVGATDIKDSINLTINKTTNIQVAMTADTLLTIHFTGITGGTCAIKLVKKVI